MSDLCSRIGPDWQWLATDKSQTAPRVLIIHLFSKKQIYCTSNVVDAFDKILELHLQF